MPDPKLQRHSVDPANLPAALRHSIDSQLPAPLATAMYAGCHELDFLKAAHFLGQFSLKQMQNAVHPSYMAAIHRLREAEIHLADFYRFMDEVGKEAEKPNLVVTDQMPPEPK